jgi:hypothetical protein
MKTTIDLDEKKLLNVMKLRGFKTRREAIDYALTEAERRAKLDKLLATPFYAAEGPTIDPNYDYRKLRDTDKPIYVRRRR